MLHRRCRLWMDCLKNCVIIIPAKLCNQRQCFSHDVELNNEGILHLHYIYYTACPHYNAVFWVHDNELHYKRGSWNGVNLTHCNLPVYLGVTLDRTLSYKAHIEKTKKKVGTRNNIIRKLRTSKWGATPTTLRSSALALCYSAAE